MKSVEMGASPAPKKAQTNSRIQRRRTGRHKKHELQPSVIKFVNKTGQVDPTVLAGRITSEDFVTDPTYDIYQALLVDILGVVDTYMGLVDYVNESRKLVRPIKVVVTGRPTDFPNEDKDHTIIYYFQGRKETHYRVYGREYIMSHTRRGKQLVPSNIDPYDLYQKKYTHGFCQMFALFIAMNDVNGFIEIDADGDNHQIYLNNTYACLKKTLALIKEIKKNGAMNPHFPDLTLYQSMERDFKNYKELNYKEYYFTTIKTRQLSFEKFLEHLSLFEVEDIKPYIDDL